MSRSFSRKWYSLGPWVFREFLHQYCRVILLLFAANWTVHCLGISGLSGGPGDLPGSSSFKAARQGRRLVHSPTSPLPPVSTRSAQSTTLQRHSQRDEDALQLEEQIFGQRGYQGDSYFFGLDDRSTVYDAVADLPSSPSTSTDSYGSIPAASSSPADSASSTPDHSINLTSQSSRHLIVGSTAVFVCEVSFDRSRPIAAVDWQHQPRIGTQPGQFGERRKLQGFREADFIDESSDRLTVRSKITIAQVQRHHAGRFICQSRSILRDSAVVEDSVDLHVEDLWKTTPIFVRGLQAVTVLEGSTVTMNCDVVGGMLLKMRLRFPNGTRIKRSTGLQQDLIVDLHNNSFRATHRSVYNAHNVTVGDAGVYSCQAANKMFNTTKVYSYGRLTVLRRVIPNIALMYGENRSQSVPLGSPARLKCSSTYTTWHPRVTLTWLKNGNALNASQNVVISDHTSQGYDSDGSYYYTEVHSVLLVKSFSNFDEGDYTCRVSSDHGVRDDSIYLYAEEAAVLFVNVNKDLRADSVNTSLLDVNVRATDQPRVEVLHNGAPSSCGSSDKCVMLVTMRDDHVGSGFYNVALTLKLVDHSSIGNYTVKIHAQAGILLYNTAVAVL